MSGLKSGPMVPKETIIVQCQKNNISNKDTHLNNITQFLYLENK